MVYELIAGCESHRAAGKGIQSSVNNVIWYKYFTNDVITCKDEFASKLPWTAVKRTVINLEVWPN